MFLRFILQKSISIFKTLSDIKHEQGMSNVFLYCYKRIVYYFFFFTKFILTLPIALIIIALKPLKEIYFVELLSSRIGHFAANTEFMLLSQSKEIYSKKKLYLFYEQKWLLICNTQLSKMWRRTLPVVPFSRTCREINKTLSVLLGSTYRNNPVKAFESCILGRDHNQLLEKRNVPYISFTPREIVEAEKKLEMFGIKKNHPFVCLLVRDAGYLDSRAPGKGLYKHHDSRNADIGNYCKAALFLAEKGYTVFRMGKHVEKIFNANHPNIIDYANHPMQCDLLDIYLAAHCQFIISTSTGLDCITQLFRKPLLFTDILPIYGQLQTWYPCVLYIPKKIRDRNTNRILTFEELKKEFSDVVDVTIQKTLEEKNAEIVPNSADEILEAVIEMESRVNNTWKNTEENEILQKLFLKNCFPSTLINEVFRDSLKNIKVRVGQQFLKKNAQWFVCHPSFENIQRENMNNVI